MQIRFGAVYAITRYTDKATGQPVPMSVPQSIANLQTGYKQTTINQGLPAFPNGGEIIPNSHLDGLLYVDGAEAKKVQQCNDMWTVQQIEGNAKPAELVLTKLSQPNGFDYLCHQVNPLP